MKQIISRPARGALPLALAVCAVLLPGGAERAAAFMAAVMLARGLSLGAGGALRSTAGVVIRASRLRGNLMTAAIMAVIGGGLSVALCAMDIPYLREIGICTAAAGAAVNLSQMLADRLYTSRDSNSAAMYDIVVAALAVVGVTIADSDKWLLPLLTGCGAIAGMLLLAGLKSGSSIQKGVRVLRYSPLSLVKGWIFPALFAAAAFIYAQLETDVAAFMLGIAVMEWCEPAYRRSNDESGECAVWLCAIALVWAVFCCIGGYYEAHMPEWNSRAAIVTVQLMGIVPTGCVCALISGLHMGKRRTAMAILMLVGCAGGVNLARCGIASVSVAALASAGLYAACLLLCIPDIRTLMLKARARKIQKRRR